MRDFLRFLVSWLETRKEKSLKLSWRRCCLVHLDERNRIEHSVLRLKVISPAKIKLAWQKLPFYVVTAELGTKNRLPGISQTIKKLEENQPPDLVTAVAKRRLILLGQTWYHSKEKSLGLCQKRKFRAALCRTLEFLFVYKTVNISR